MNAMEQHNQRRIAMWSGPRNISTAMMRAWENRPDTEVVDEPFYACYLTKTGVVHPMQPEVLAAQSSDWQTVIDTELRQTLSPNTKIQYQKHMTQHMVAEINHDWFSSLSHAFLIRHPADVVVSYGQKRGEVTAADIGFKRQKELFDLACQCATTPPPVIDSKTVLINPKAALSRLCEALSLPFHENMLSWPAGKRTSDGVWAPHWYQNVEQSTGFAPYTEKTPTLNVEQQRVVDECMPYYKAMLEHSILI